MSSKFTRKIFQFLLEKLCCFFENFAGCRSLDGFSLGISRRRTATILWSTSSSHPLHFLPTTSNYFVRASIGFYSTQLKWRPKNGRTDRRKRAGSFSSTIFSHVFYLLLQTVWPRKTSTSDIGKILTNFGIYFFKYC